MQRSFSRFAIIGSAFAAIVGITVLITGHPASKLSREPALPHRIGVPDDWSHHHLVFSNPGTYEQAAKTGASYAKWLTIRYDTRFILQQMKRRAEATWGLPRELSAGGEEAVLPPGLVGPEELTIGLHLLPTGGEKAKPKPAPKPKRTQIKRDWSVSLSPATVQPNAYPAKWGASLTSASCSSDFVVYPTGMVGAGPNYWGLADAPSIVAYKNLYSGCGSTVPSLYWASFTYGNSTDYNGGTATISTSPIISLDGSQVAFVQSGSNGSSLAILKWTPYPSPVTPDFVAPSDYRDCTNLPCMAWLAQTGSYAFANDTFSAPYYDFAYDDALYVGDDAGYLRKFTGIFYGTPALAPSPWPVQLSTTSKLTSPVYDPVSGLVFVGDTGGVLHAVTTSGTVVGTSDSLGDAIIDAPLVDSTAGMVYVFVATDSKGKNAVFQFPTSFTSGSGSSVELGTGGTGYYLYAGDFDNVYYSSSTPGSPSGNLYVVGNTGDTKNGATLYQISISSNTMKSVTQVATGLTSTGTHPWPSPLTEFCNNGTSSCGTDGSSTTSGTDYLFFSVNEGAVGGCADSSGNGCVLSYNITMPSSPSLSAAMNITNVGSPGCWATGGLVIDNSVPSGTLAGASQVYFINLNGVPTGGDAGLTNSSCGPATPESLSSVTGSTTVGSNTVTLRTSGSVPWAYVGGQISDSGGAIPTGDTITDVTPTTLTLAIAATATASNDILTIDGNIIQGVQASQSALK
jgi:hypothetical protein